MQVKKSVSKTKATLTVNANEKDLGSIKAHVLGHFQENMKVAGFREGKAPLSVVEKNVDQNSFQTEFLQEAIGALYSQAVRETNLRVVDQPEVQLTKFVPFTELEFTAEVPVVGEVKLGDYKELKADKPKVSVTTKDVNEVVKSLQTRMAEKKDVKRAAKNGDQVWIDFRGVDDKGKPVNGADGKDYPLLLGSNTFIPGFEPELVGLKAGDEKTFTVTFPKDYRVAALKGKKVTFTVNVTKVQEVIEPEVNDEFAAKAGPFKTVSELKDDIKKQLTHERSNQAERDYESELVRQLADKSTIEIPDVLLNDQIDRMLNELKQNLTYRGQTLQEFLEAEHTTEEKYKNEVLRPEAEQRVKAGLVLAEVADAENLTVQPEELEIRMQVLKGQYKDPQMQAELEKPENRREIASRLLTEKTIAKLKSINS